MRLGGRLGGISSQPNHPQIFNQPTLPKSCSTHQSSPNLPSVLQMRRRRRRGSDKIVDPDGILIWVQHCDESLGEDCVCPDLGLPILPVESGAAAVSRGDGEHVLKDRPAKQLIRVSGENPSQSLVLVALSLGF